MARETQQQAGSTTQLDTAQLLSQGMALIDEGRTEEALSCLERAVEIDPRNEAIWIGKGITFIAIGDFRKGLASFERAVRLNPGKAEAWFGSGAALAYLGHTRRRWIVSTAHCKSTSMMSESGQTKALHCIAWTKSKRR
jgi:Flp pilus assembly protein TadD